jgi:signal transduction histidine kinase
VNEIKARPVNQANLETFLKQKEQRVSSDPSPWDTDLTALDLSGIKIALSILWLSNPFLMTLVKGARAEARRLGVELVVHEPKRILGVLAVQSEVAGDLDVEDQLALEGVAGQIAVVLEKMLLLETVEERTQALQTAQESLIRQEKLAVLGQLADGVAHEIRNPLGVIANAIYFLRLTSPDADETTQNYLDLIADRIKDTERIVSALLDLTHTRLPMRETVAVDWLVADVLEQHPPPEQVQVTTGFATNLPPVFVDATQISHQVLANLVTNAYQAMPNGGALTISAHSEDGQVKLSIADTGVGMSPETMEKIFEPLYTTKAKGIGLGLAISKNLAEVNGGSIEVESVEGQGSTFTISLPLAP